MSLYVARTWSLFSASFAFPRCSPDPANLRYELQGLRTCL